MKLDYLKRPDVYAKLTGLSAQISFFSSSIDNGIVDSAYVADYEKMIKSNKELYVNEVHHRSIHPQKRKQRNGEEYSIYVTKVKDGKVLSAVNRDTLIDKLYDYYRHEIDALHGKKYLLKDLMPLWLTSKAEGHTSAKSLREYKLSWDKYYSDDPISNKDIRTLTIKDWRDFFRCTVSKHRMTKKRFKDFRIVANGIITYCIDNDILSSNAIRDINIDALPFVQEPAYNNVKATPFTEAQKNQVIEWCKAQLTKPRVSKIYYLTILFNLSIGLRYGELAGLRWIDVDFDNDTISITGQTIPVYEMAEDFSFRCDGKKRVEHVKSYEEPRVIPLTPGEVTLLKQIKSLNISAENVFPLRYHTYNDKIKKVASEIGLDPTQFHTHCLRATAATSLYNSVKDVRQVQVMLGHSTPAMTEKYIHNIKGIESLRNARILASNNCITPTLPPVDDKEKPQNH